MLSENVDRTVRAGFFSSVASADQAVRALLAAGFDKSELAVICPEIYKNGFARDLPHAGGPGISATEGIAAGGLVGATLGGLALAAVAIGTGGAALLPAATVLIGGAALAGGFSGLIVADGYDKGVDEYYEQAVQLGKIVVGVRLEGPGGEERLNEAARILVGAGADFLEPA
jgi:hypothetical protein